MSLLPYVLTSDSQVIVFNRHVWEKKRQQTQSPRTSTEEINPQRKASHGMWWAVAGCSLHLRNKMTLVKGWEQRWRQMSSNTNGRKKKCQGIEGEKRFLW